MSLDTYDSPMPRCCSQALRPGRTGLPGLRVVVLAAATLALTIPAVGAAKTPHAKKNPSGNTLYNSFSAPPYTLDPAATYGSGLSILMDVVEAPLQYNYVDRPHKLEPLLASEMPKRTYLDVWYDGNSYRCPVYTVHIKNGVMYQNSPCFVKEYRHLTAAQLRGISSIHDFKKTATREMTADDFVYGVRRLCDWRTRFPQFGTFADHLLGFHAFNRVLGARIFAARKKEGVPANLLYKYRLDARFHPVALDYNEGADRYPFIRKVDRYTFQVVEVGKKIDLNHPDAKVLDVKGYPQIRYWMTFGFFAPVPHEAVEFFSQPGLAAKGITFDKNPVGTGPYMLDTFDPNSRIVLTRNPNFRDEKYPSLAKPNPKDAEAVKNYKLMKANGLLNDCGKRLPFIDKIVWRFEPDPNSRWRDFLRGDYDTSGIPIDQFDQAVSRTSQGELYLTKSMAHRGIRLLQTTTAALSYDMFNMSDPVVGGYSAEKQKLRQAISIAINSREKIDSFFHGLGMVAQGPIPPGIFGYVPGKAGMNPYVFNWDAEKERPVRKPISYARKLLAEAGYPDGRDANGKPLTIHYLTYGVSPRIRAEQMLLRKQLARIHVQLEFEALGGKDFARKIESGDFQLAPEGWVADYPDPETFLILFHRPESLTDDARKKRYYYNPRFEKLYSKMVSMDDTPERLKIVKEMDAILYKDAPAVFETHAVWIALVHGWLHNYFPYPLAIGTDKYRRIDVAARSAYEKKHNVPSSRSIGRRRS